MESDKKMKTIRKNTKPLYVDDKNNYAIVYYKGTVLILSGTKIMESYRLPLGIKKRTASKIRLTERLLRLVPRGIGFIENDNICFGYHGKMYLIDRDRKCLVEEYSLPVGMGSPLNIEEVKGIEGFDDSLVFGEYRHNKEQKPVAVYARGLKKADCWEKKCEFIDKGINHIHAVISDPYRNCLIVLTGDKDKGSGIWCIRDNYKTVECMVSGKQKYRSSVAFPVEEGILYATDTPLEQNYICLLTKENGRWREKKLAKITGPCVYAVRKGKDIYFSTTVEPDSRLPTVKKMLTRKIGNGIMENASHVFRYSGGEAKDILRIEKDFLPMGLFQFGSIQFPKQESRHLHMYMCGLKHMDGRWVLL